MGIIAVGLPDAVKRWIEAQVDAGNDASVSDDLHDLLTEAEASDISPRGFGEIFCPREGAER